MQSAGPPSARWRLLRAEGSSSRLVPEPEPTRPAVSPATAFLLLVLVLVAIGALIFFTRPDAPPPPEQSTTASEPNFALTDAEAIARFEELAEVRRRAYASQDVSLLSSLYTSDSVVAPLAEKEIRRLNREGVSDVSSYQTLRLTVTSNSSQEISLREVVLVRPRFVDKKGNDVTVGDKKIREVVRWTLRLEGSEWLIHDAVIQASDSLR